MSRRKKSAVRKVIYGHQRADIGARYIPSRSQIAKAMQEIRSKWSETETLSRFMGDTPGPYEIPSVSTAMLATGGVSSGIRAGRVHFFDA